MRMQIIDEEKRPSIGSPVHRNLQIRILESPKSRKGPIVQCVEYFQSQYYRVCSTDSFNGQLAQSKLLLSEMHDM